MHTGTKTTVGGRYKEQSSDGLTDSLRKIGFISGRLKTGTPPRIDKNTIDFLKQKNNQATKTHDHFLSEF